MSYDWSTAAAIAAVALACTIYYTAQAWFAHRERMAKIAQGIDPGNPTKGGVEVRTFKTPPAT